MRVLIPANYRQVRLTQGSMLKGEGGFDPPVYEINSTTVRLLQFCFATAKTYHI